MKAKKKPVEIDFFDYSTKDTHLLEFWIKSLGDSFAKNFFFENNILRVKTLEGTSYEVTDKDVIIRGVKGEYYPCKIDIFYETYEVGGNSTCFVNQDIIKILHEMNGEKYNMHKASEECQELGLVLNQKLLKPHKVDDQEIIDEIGDVIIRVEILKRMYDIDKIQTRINKKLADYKKYLDHKTYNQI